VSKFSYVVKDPEGKTYQNVAEAESRAELIKNLQMQKYFIVSIEEMTWGSAVKFSSGAVRKEFSHRGVKLNDQLTFARQMATMLSAGVNLSRTLNVLIQQVDSAKFYQVLKRIQKDVENGVSLSIAMSQHPEQFDQFWVSLVEVGEASGTMPMVLNKLSLHLERRAAFRSTIISGVIYPVILLCVCFGAVLFFALVVGPQFQNVFDTMHVSLPWLTRTLLSVFDAVRHNFFLIMFLMVGAVVSLSYFVRNTHKGKTMFETFIFKLPMVGEIYRFGLVEKFASQMAILIEAGVPILYALDIIERLVDNNTCALVINRIKEGVKRGDNMATPMAQSGFFPPMAVQMIVVGEETGQLNQMMGFVAKYYEELVSTFMKRFSTIIEPLIILFMGVIVGIVITAMFLPLINIAKLSGGGG